MHIKFSRNRVQIFPYQATGLNLERLKLWGPIYGISVGDIFCPSYVAKIKSNIINSDFKKTKKIRTKVLLSVQCLPSGSVLCLYVRLWKQTVVLHNTRERLERGFSFDQGQPFLFLSSGTRFWRCLPNSEHLHMTYESNFPISFLIKLMQV